MRPRTLLYAALMAIISAGMVLSLVSRGDLHLSVAPDRNPLFVTLSDGSVRNGYTLNIVNKLDTARTLAITAEGLPSAELKLVGNDNESHVVTAPAAEVLNIKVYLSVPKSALENLAGTSSPIAFRVTEIDADGLAAFQSSFRWGEK